MSFALLLALDGEKVLVGIMQWAMGKRKKILLLLNATKNIPGLKINKNTHNLIYNNKQVHL